MLSLRREKCLQHTKSPSVKKVRNYGACPTCFACKKPHYVTSFLHKFFLVVIFQWEELLIKLIFFQPNMSLKTFHLRNIILQLLHMHQIKENLTTQDKIYFKSSSFNTDNNVDKHIRVYCSDDEQKAYPCFIL